jgi:four helix bundle protein
MSDRISGFRELRVYHAAFELQQQFFGVSKSFPAEERYSLTDQVRRAVRSVGANIAEAWQKRRYPAHFTSKLTDAYSELLQRPIAILADLKRRRQGTGDSKK